MAAKDVAMTFNACPTQKMSGGAISTSAVGNHKCSFMNTDTNEVLNLLIAKLEAIKQNQNNITNKLDAQERTLGELSKVANEQLLLGKTRFTLEEAVYLKRSYSTVAKMSADNVITTYCPGGKCKYVLKADLDAWLLSKRVASVSEIDSMIVTA